MNIFFMILFYLLFSLFVFAIIYSSDIADIASDDFENYLPDIADVGEEKIKNTYEVNDYIKNTICPRYHHQILKKEIEYYQSKHIEYYYISIGTICLFWCLIAAQLFIKDKFIDEWFFSYLISLGIGTICYFIVRLIYKKYWRCLELRISNYYDRYSSYDWEQHYCYLLDIKNTVVFRYALRKIIEFLSAWIYLLFFLNVPD